MENRRRFLRVVGLAALSGLGHCSDSARAAEASGTLALGPPENYPPGTLRALPDHPLAIGHDTGGLYALTTICTHLQCDMRRDGVVNERGLSCDCHGSDFDPSGTPLHGPAVRPLRHVRLSLEAGSLIAHADEEVSADTRLALP